MRCFFRFGVGIILSPSPLTRRSPRGRCGLRFAFGRRLHCFDFFEISLTFRRGG